MDDKYALMRHFQVTFAYRTEKTLRDAPSDFAAFEAGEGVRHPAELVRHMTSLLGYACTYFVGGQYRAETLPTLSDELGRFHDMLHDVARHLKQGTPLREISPERLLQGPLVDAMTHAGQLTLLRRLAGSPVPPENFLLADMDAARLAVEQPEPVSPDEG